MAKNVPISKACVEARKGLGMTQEQFAKRIGSTRAVVSCVEQGQRVPPPRAVGRIQRYYNFVMKSQRETPGPEPKVPETKVLITKRALETALEGARKNPKDRTILPATEIKWQPKTARGTARFYVEFERTASLGNGRMFRPDEWLGDLLMLCREEGLNDGDTIILLTEVAKYRE